MYEQFCEILSIHGSRTLNPSNFLDYLASLITIYIGKNQTISISKYTSNNYINNNPLSITNIDMLIPYYAPRDKISFRIPLNIENKMRQALEIEKEKNDEYIDWDSNSENKINLDMNIKTDICKSDNNIFNINASYAFGAIPDQRLFADDKCMPYIMDETFRWVILYNTIIKPPKLENKPAGFEKVVAAAIISDGNNYTYCIYGTRNGLYYNSIETQKPILLIDEMVDGIFRQNDYLFVLCQGPILYNISLTINGNITTNEIFRTKRTYNIYTYWNSFIGGYYDNVKDILLLGTNLGQLYIFKNGGLLDSKFNSRFDTFRRKQIDNKIELGNLMYFDNDRNCIVYIGNKYVMIISLNKMTNGDYQRTSDDKFGKIYDIKWFLKGITYDCNYFMYIYHQKTLVILKRVQSSAHCPYVLKVYTGKSLRFK